MYVRLRDTQLVRSPIVVRLVRIDILVNIGDLLYRTHTNKEVYLNDPKLF